MREKIYINIKNTLDSIKTERFIIGLSGGLDSTVVAALESQTNKHKRMRI
ncbi:MAG: hypothetical protein QXK74_01255 [Candidatus Nitrosocaldaceae archaeon]